MSEQQYHQLADSRRGAYRISRGVSVAVAMAIGSSFAATNTMYAAVARRAREIGTLRVLGFSRGSILTSFFLESVSFRTRRRARLSASWMPLNGCTTGIGSSNFLRVGVRFPGHAADHPDRHRVRRGAGGVGGSSRRAWPRIRRFLPPCDKSRSLWTRN